jgi:aminodeoxyfutalosine deaminase
VGAAWVGRTLGVRLQFSPDFPRDRRLGDSTVAVEATLEFAIAHRDEGVIALVLGGNETGHPPELFETICQHAKTHELCSCPHAGET